MAAPTSTGIGQGSAQIIDLSPIDRQIQQGYAADVALARKNKEDKDAFIGKQAENLKAITKAKIYTGHIPYFKQKSEELWKYVKENANNFKDPNVEAELMQRMGQLLREAEGSEQTEKSFLEDAKFIRERGGERFVKGADAFKGFQQNPFDEEGNLRFYQPSLSKYDPPSYPESIDKYAKLIGTVERGGSSMFTNPDGTRGVRTTSNKTANWQTAISAVNEDYLTNPDARELYDRVYNEVPANEKKQLAKMGIDNPVAYTAYRAGQTKNVGSTSSITNIDYGERDGEQYNIIPQLNANLKTTSQQGKVIDSTAILQNAATFPSKNTVVTGNNSFKNASKPNETYKGTDILNVKIGQIAYAPVYKKGTKGKGNNVDVGGQIVPTERLEDSKGSYDYIPVVFGTANYADEEGGGSAVNNDNKKTKESFDFYAPASQFKSTVPSKLYKQYETQTTPTQTQAGNRTPRTSATPKSTEPSLPSASKQEWINAGWNEAQINQAVSQGRIIVK